MISFVVADIVEVFYTVMLPIVRVGAMLLTAPVFSMDSVTLKIRVIVTIALTAAIYPLIDWPTIDPLSAEGLMEIAHQALIGITMGLFLQIISAAFVVAGQTISTTMGLAMATLSDPNLGTVPVIGQLLTILGVLIFLGSGGHIILIEMLLESFRLLPIGERLYMPEIFPKLIAWSGTIFLGAVLIAIPILSVMLLINIGLGIVARAAPQLNIFAVGFPAMIIVGLFVLITAMNGIGMRMQYLWNLGLNSVKTTVLGVS
ncbi:MAG: flagellar biosynthetic protein FliR [Betaproteobacteria bacterium TMED82]|nr:MAG: flagellar biosynthetic protein FliR [Betaproteobacteria bacterium TMED82]|tara:strand:- start:52863 stop:53639 length:777 start_codon:yes stop_codon:yes gene_type:complete